MLLFFKLCLISFAIYGVGDFSVCEILSVHLQLFCQISIGLAIPIIFWQFRKGVFPSVGPIQLSGYGFLIIRYRNRSSFSIIGHIPVKSHGHAGGLGTVPYFFHLQGYGRHVGNFICMLLTVCGCHTRILLDVSVGIYLHDLVNGFPIFICLASRHHFGDPPPDSMPCFVLVVRFILHFLRCSICPSIQHNHCRRTEVHQVAVCISILQFYGNACTGRDIVYPVFRQTVGQTGQGVGHRCMVFCQVVIRGFISTIVCLILT